MGERQRLADARSAYARRDAAASQQAHATQRITHAREQHGGRMHLYLGDLVSGGLGGITTTFAVVSGVAGLSLGEQVLLGLGLANLLANGFSWAIIAYLSAKSGREYYDRERAREAWEIEHYPEGEWQELYAVYRQHGYGDADARRLTELQSRHHAQWVDEMMAHELGLTRDDRRPSKVGLATLAAFVLAGGVPLLAFLLGSGATARASGAFFWSLAPTAGSLVALGAAKAYFTRSRWWVSGLEMLGVGGAVGAAAYALGHLLKGFVG